MGTRILPLVFMSGLHMPLQTIMRHGPMTANKTLIQFLQTLFRMELSVVSPQRCH